jgi:hypothetical protein
VLAREGIATVIALLEVTPIKLSFVKYNGIQD